jgi:hypothetical protein
MLTKLAMTGLPAAVIAVAAAAPAAGSAGQGRAGAADAARHSRNELSTLVGSLRVRAQPSITAAVTGRLGQRGTVVTVDCWSNGTLIAGNPVWYHISRPRQGYVTSYYVDTHFDPMAGLPRCITSTFRRSYRTLVAGLRIRSGPTTRSGILEVLGPLGTRVTVNCFTDGRPVSGDPVWYHLVMPRSGYLTGRDLNTGSDPAPGVPHC